MTTVTFHMEDDRITGFDSQGHSGYAEAGADIVCAAVTSAVRLVGASKMNDADACRQGQRRPGPCGIGEDPGTGDPD